MPGYKKGVAIKLSKNFKTTEFDCRCSSCSTTLINSDLVSHLQKIRNHFKKPVVINSGYRCASHNRRVGGARYSQHLFGNAADIVVKGVKPSEVAAYCETLGVNGIGRYRTFTHIDVRGYKARWNG